MLILYFVTILLATQPKEYYLYYNEVDYKEGKMYGYCNLVVVNYNGQTKISVYTIFELKPLYKKEYELIGHGTMTNATHFEFEIDFTTCPPTRYNIIYAHANDFQLILQKEK